MKRILLSVFAACTAMSAVAQSPVVTNWGDQGNGTYVNPILNADYSDPDAIRVGDKYYMVASDFHFMGMQMLESDDLVNWTLVSKVYDRINLHQYEEMDAYAEGSWAPALRYHDGKFWVFFCTPYDGLFMTTATDPHGPWAPLHHVKDVDNWEDPCPFWDEDGQAYLGRSILGAGPIIIHKMSPDGRELLDEGRTVYTGPVAEGTKIHKFGEYYYLSIPEGGVQTGWQTILRSKNIYGPYEKKVVLEQGMTAINGPHQGSIVDTPDGEWWFLHFQEHNPIGRVVHLQPMHWKDGWPVIGVDQDMNGIGEPVLTWRNPGWKVHKNETELRGDKIVEVNDKGCLPAHSDDFNSPELGLQWQFNHNPVDGEWSLTERKGWLTINALKGESFRKARNTIAQKSMGYVGEFTVKLDLSSLKENDYAGLAMMAQWNWQVGVMKKDGKLYLYKGSDDNAVEVSLPYMKNVIYLRIHLNALANTYSFSYSENNKDFTPIGDSTDMWNGHWKGLHPAVFCYNTEGKGGKAHFDWAIYDIKDNHIVYKTKDE